MSIKVRLYPTDKYKKQAIDTINCRVWHSHVVVASFLLERTTVFMLHCTIAVHASNGLIASNAPIGRNSRATQESLDRERLISLQIRITTFPKCLPEARYS